MIIEVDKSHYENIKHVLNGVQKDSKAILKRAINNTAKQSRKTLATEAKKKYAVKVSGFNKSMKTKNATVSRPEAIISATGEAMELGQFKARPFRVSNGADRPDVIKAKVLTENGLKKLVKGDTKAFVAKFRSGHVAIVERDSSRKMKSNQKKDYLKKLLSPSIPQMLGNEKNVYQKVEPEIEELLSRNIRFELQKVLEKR